jgi:hypothetical protein
MQGIINPLPSISPSFARTGEAFWYIEAEHKKGTVVITASKDDNEKS